MRNRIHTRTTDLGIAAGVLLGGLALGAGLMTIFDPQRGRSRRAFAGQKMRRMVRVAGERIEGQRCDLTNRSRGLMSSVRSRMEHRGETVSDGQLEARVRSRMGHVISHPGAVDVTCCDGCVMLAGDILASEADTLLKTIRSIPGVTSVEEDLNRFTDPSHVPSLQGGREFRRLTGRRAMGSSGGVSTLTLLASCVALYGAMRMFDLDLGRILERGLTGFRSGPMEDMDMDFEEDIDSMERSGLPPDWTETRSVAITLDRVR